MSVMAISEPVIRRRAWAFVYTSYLWFFGDALGNGVHGLSWAPSPMML
ncbi:MAG: hypothetical protein AABZ12_11505 [Planctomycetota bacterium]